MSFAGRHAGGGGLGHRRRRATGAVVELTPLIDITFQLLIFFLLTATFQDNSSLDVDLARAKNQQKSQEEKAVVVSIAEDGRLELDGKLVDERELEMRLCQDMQEGKSKLHIRGDRNSRHEILVRTIDQAKACGFKSIGILHQN